MPDGFKKESTSTDARGMSDSAVNDTLGTFLLDGELPRLGEPARPVVTPDLSLAADVSFAPPPPGSAPLLQSSAPTLPTPTLGSPVLPGSVQPSIPTTATPTGESDEPAVEAEAPRHPMAHLMPEKTQPSESSLRAAQLRAEKKSKARKKKLIGLVIFLAVAALVGPPLGRWLVDAINDAGKVQTDEPPATTVKAATDSTATTVPASDGAGARADDDSVVGVIAGAPGRAQDAVDKTNDAAKADATVDGTGGVAVSTVP